MNHELAKGFTVRKFLSGWDGVVNVQRYGPEQVETRAPWGKKRVSARDRRLEVSEVAC